MMKYITHLLIDSDFKDWNVHSGEFYSKKKFQLPYFRLQTLLSGVIPYVLSIESIQFL